MAVRITGWHVEGFGVLHDYGVVEIPAGLTVFTGPNEAGKSTLLAFIRTMLFGFPAGAADSYYPPLRGGRHGGQLAMADPHGTVYTVDRQSGRRPPVVSRQDREASQEDLRRLLGGCDRQLFQSIFAFDLADLQELEGLDHASVRERLALVGITGSGTSPTAAIAQLEQRRAMAQLASGGNGIDDLQRRLEDVERSLKAARHQTSHDRILRKREQTATRLLESKRLEIADLNEQQQRSGALLQAWPDWTVRQQAEAERSRIELDDTARDNAEVVETLSAELGSYQTALEELPNLEQAQADAEGALAARLRDLGPDWDRARLEETPDSGARSAEAEQFVSAMDEAEAVLADATRALIATRAEVTRHARETSEHEARRSSLAAIIGDRGIEERQAALRRLRARRSDLTSAEVQLQIERTSLEGLDELRLQSERTTSYVPPGWLVAVALAILVAAAAGAVFLFANGDVLTGLVVAAVALGSLVLGLVIRSQTDRVERQRAHQLSDIGTRINLGQTTLEQHRAHVATLRNDIAANAATLGLSPLPSHTEIEDAERRLIEAEAAHQALNRQQDELRQAAGKAEDLFQRVETAALARDQAAASRDAMLADWTAWRSQCHLPEALDPRGAIDFLALVNDGQEKARDLGGIITKLGGYSETIERGQTRIVALSAAMDIAQEEIEADLVAVMDRLRQRLTRDREARETVAALDLKAAQVTERMVSILSNDALLWDALPSGTPETWDRELSDASSQIAALEAERLSLAQAVGETQIERRAIEQSDELPTLNLRQSMLEADLESALREHRVLLLAETLIRDTVQRIEQERQPDVLRRASSLFARITDGRYQRVFCPVEGQALEIEDGNGTTRPPEALSRGTLEQLYVALRLGLAEAFTENVGALPLIMDDVLVNFDPERARGVAQALFDVSGGRQVLIFTSQPGTVELLAGIGDQFGHFAMERHGTGGEWVKHP